MQLYVNLTAIIALNKWFIKFYALKTHGKLSSNRMKQKNLVLTSDVSISKITNFKDKFSSEVYKNKAERIFFRIAFVLP